MKKKFQIGFFIILFTFGLIYLGLWAYSAKWFAKEIDKLYANGARDGLQFLGPKPELTNFPFVPEVRYTGGIKAGDAQIVFPHVVLRGYPIPLTSLKLSFPEGVSLGGIVDPVIWSLNTLEAEIAIPYRIPADFNYEELAAWQKKGGKIDVRHYQLTKGSLFSEGSGLLTLDANLQPVFSMTSDIRGHEAFIKEQKDKGLIEPFAAAVGVTMLNNFVHTDEKTGEKIVALSVGVQDRMLRVGPLQVLQLPEISWDRRTSLAQPR